MIDKRPARALTLAALLAAAVVSGGCVPLVVGGAALGGSMVVTDRRSSATQLEDQTLEIKAANRIREVVGDRAHISVTSYNRALLLTGEIFKEEDRAAIEQAPRSRRADQGPLDAIWLQADGGDEDRTRLWARVEDRDPSNDIHVGRRFYVQGNVDPPAAAGPVAESADALVEGA